MKRKQSLYKPAAIGMSLLMTAGLTACRGSSTSSDTKADKFSTSGNAPHGLNKVDCNIFTYQQYVDKLVYWGRFFRRRPYCSPKSSQNTEEVSWTLPGSSQKSAEGESVTVTYDKTGVYDVAVTAKNKSGEDEKTYTVNENEAPPFTVDGDVKKKWCATGTAPHELTIDLGAETTLDTFAPVNARYVKLSVVKPTQGSDSVARIYEVQVYGSETPLAQ